jgi:hypothetical protein
MRYKVCIEARGMKMKTELAKSYARNFRIDALNQIADWADLAAEALENQSFDETNMSDFVEDAGEYANLSLILRKIIRAAN